MIELREEKRQDKQTNPVSQEEMQDSCIFSTSCRELKFLPNFLWHCSVGQLRTQYILGARKCKHFCLGNISRTCSILVWLPQQTKHRSTAAMCSRPRPTGCSSQFGSSLGFGATLRLLWAWPRHTEAGRGSVWPYRCTERCHILLALHLSYKPMFLLWELNQGLCEVSFMQRQQKGWAFIEVQCKETWAVLHRKGRENSMPRSLFFLPILLAMRNVSGPPWMYLSLLKNAPRFCSLT